MSFTKYNNPSKRRRRKYIDRSTADILAAKSMVMDRMSGIEVPLKTYDAYSDRLCNKPSRNIY